MKARDNGPTIDIYPNPRDRWVCVTILKPRTEVSLRTGKPGFIPASVEFMARRANSSTIRRTVRFAKALVAAAHYALHLNFSARWYSK